ncbi:uncharacterized protein LOC131148083 [Malania oleifera]|uniref:uncharacterized protein LOC131148083 n=1 Tax=Malania oleifera TaxID=397392 RepID=UPI0025AE99C0|nr:uncharacterized protein LOC131148083 [Malania oleifera]
METTAESILGTFRRFQANQPLLDAIKKSSRYARIIRELYRLQKESRATMNGQVRLTEHWSSMSQSHLPPKLKDPSSPIISCVIGDYAIKVALLDLRASVNILPYSAYQQLNIGKLQPTQVTLSLTDQSLKKPRVVVEDVIVIVGEFPYSIDFIILDMESSTNPILVLLGRPFLSTVNACIQCRTEIMDISWGHKQHRLNIFNASQYPLSTIQVVDKAVMDKFFREATPSML